MLRPGAVDTPIVAWEKTLNAVGQLMIIVEFQ
jgi:hypothetical protein